MNRTAVLPAFAVAAAAAAVAVLGHPAPTEHSSSVAAPARASVADPLAPGWKPKNPKPFGDERSAYEPDHDPDVMDGHLINPSDHAGGGSQRDED
jgi:hypothetical protein